MRLRFVIIDEEIKEKYPLNFVSVLPRDIYSINERQSFLTELDKEGRFKLIHKLLKEAAETYNADPEILQEILKRISIIERSKTFRHL